MSAISENIRNGHYNLGRFKKADVAVPKILEKKDYELTPQEREIVEFVRIGYAAMTSFSSPEERVAERDRVFLKDLTEAFLGDLTWEHKETVTLYMFEKAKSVIVSQEEDAWLHEIAENFELMSGLLNFLIHDREFLKKVTSSEDFAKEFDAIKP